jgi:small subunit ribosomal protein S9
LASSVGRRKTSVARVYMAEGSGKIEINKRDIVNYFPKGTNRYEVNQPMNLLKLANKYDLNINVVGGGPSGQAGAIRLGIARALLKIDPNFKAELRAAGFLTRDSRKVERKKAGLAGARRRFQYSKR